MPPLPRRALLAALAFFLLGPRSGHGQTDARAVVRTARRAVEGDSAAALGARWRERLRRDPGDRLARLGLGTIAQHAYDYATADRELGQLTAAGASADAVTLYAFIERADALAGRNRNAEARPLLEQARRLGRALGDRPGEAVASIRLAAVVARLDGFPPAVALVDSARSLVPSGEPALLADLLRRRAVFLAWMGRPEAMTEVAAARALAARSGDAMADAQALRAAGVVHLLRGENDAAGDSLERAAVRLRALHDRRELALLLMELASARLFVGRMGDTEAASREALAAAQASGNARAAGQALLGLGNIALNMGDLPAAGTHLERALRTFEAAGDEAMMTLARDHLALLLNARGDLARARAEMQRARDYYARVGNGLGYFNAQRSIAGFTLRADEPDEAERLTRELFVYGREHNMEARTHGLWRDLGAIALRQGRLDAAERATTRHLALLDSSDHANRFTARLQLADVHARRRDVARVERELTDANEELDRWRRTLGERELRALAFQAELSDQLDRAETTARLLALLASAGRVDAAFALAERQRARELSDRLARASAFRGTPSGAAPVPASRRMGESSGALTAARAVAMLPESTAVLEYVAAGRAPTTLLVTTRAGMRAHVLPPIDALAPDIHRLVALVADGADPGVLGRRLGAALLEPASAELRGVRRLVVVPDAALHHLPFDVLVLADGRRAVERWAVTLSPSATVSAMLSSARPAAPGAEATLLAFGDPVFPPGAPSGGVAPADLYRSAFDSAAGLTRLRESGREARLVARYAPRADVRLREAASAAYLKHAPLDGFRVLHLATHALVDERSAARTALALAPGDGESGFVSPGDLAALRLDADLVVLSACRTAGGVIVGGEGVQGLTAPLLQAGARSVVATSWRIADRATVPFVRAFYDAMAAGQPVGEALRTAKLDAIRRGAPPSEWAAFQLIGDPLVRVPLRRPSPARWPWALALVALAGAGALYSLMRRRRAIDRRSLPSSA